MPSFAKYQKHMSSPKTGGQIRKEMSDKVIEATWDEDIAAKVAYIYDYYHDDEPLLIRGLHPEKSKTKFPVDIKFIINAYNSENRDIVGKHLQFKPSFDWHEHEELSYYKDVFEEKYRSEFPIGMYVDIYDTELREYRKWLITEYANTFDMQFVNYYILPCDHVFQWVHDNKLYQMSGVSRSQSSYILCAS